MRILLLSYYFPPDICAGSFRCQALCRALQQQTESCIDLITTAPNRYPSYSEPAATHERQDNLYIYRVPMREHNNSLWRQAWSFWHYFRAAWQQGSKEDYDLVIATSSRLFTAWLGALIASRQGCRLYLDIRDLFIDAISDTQVAKFLQLLLPLLKRIELYTFRSADIINMVSPAFKPYIEALASGVKLSVFSNGIDPEFLAQPEPIRQRQEGQRVTIVYAGNIGEGQGLELIIPDLASKLRGRVQFILIGDGGRCARLRQQLEQYRLDNVILKPPMSRKELLKELYAADILFVHLNRYRAFQKVLPSKLFEYAAIPRPILCGLSGYARDFARQQISHSYLFDPCDSDAALKQIESLLPLVMQPLSIDRHNFIETYARESIMDTMAADILRLLSDSPSR